MKNTLLKVSLPLAFLLCFSNASATDSWYFAASGLNANYEDGIDESGYSVAVGKYINDNVSVELGYASFGDGDETLDGINGEFEAAAIQVSAVGYLSLSDNAGLFARFGVERVKTDIVINGSRLDEDKTNPYYGVGGYMNVTENIDVRLEVQHHEVLDTDLNTVSAGITVKTY